MEQFLAGFEQYLTSNPILAYIAIFIGGILDSFTPCVYPVIPIVVAYIGASSAGSKSRAFLLSISYVFGMALVYTTLGFTAALTGQVFGRISTHPLVYFLIGNLCILLGLSMFDVFRIPLPKLMQRIRPQKKGSGLIGAFLMGTASGFIVGPCTAPIMAVTLAYVATKKNILYGSTLLFTFALGMGLLFVLVGTFSGILTSLPKSGPWLVKIKKFLGLVLIAVGEYFLILMGRMLL